MLTGIFCEFGDTAHFCLKEIIYFLNSRGLCGPVMGPRIFEPIEMLVFGKMKGLKKLYQFEG
jgi:hypothetical protein